MYQKTGSRPQNCPRLQRTQPKLPHWQKLNERNHWIYVGYWQSKCQHFFNFGSNIWILANESGWRLTESDSFHHTLKRAIPLDHLNYGLTWLPSKLSTANGGVLRDIQKVLIYIDNLLVHTETYEKHLQVLNKVLAWLHKNHLKINLEKCVFGNKEVSYFGFTLTPEGIKHGKNKLKGIKDAKPPTDIKMIISFMGLCNFFRTHIKDTHHGLAFQIHKEGLGLQLRTSSRQC